MSIFVLLQHLNSSQTSLISRCSEPASSGGMGSKVWGNSRLNFHVRRLVESPHPTSETSVLNLSKRFTCVWQVAEVPSIDVL